MGTTAAQEQTYYYCCCHNRTPQNRTHCIRMVPYVNPCCIHTDRSHQNCNSKNLTMINMFVNSTILVSLLAYVFQFLLNSYIIYAIVLGSLAYFIHVRGSHLTRDNVASVAYAVMFVIAINILSSILIHLTWLFFNPWWLLLGGLLFLYMFMLEKERTLVRKQFMQRDVTKRCMIKEENCVVCWERKSTHACFPCLHAAYCGQCIKKLSSCALCRARIIQKQRIQSF